MKSRLGKGIAPKMLLVAFLISTLTIIGIPSASALDIDLDGAVDETSWTPWFSDDSQSPNFDAYWCNNSDKLYLGIITDDDDGGEDVLVFAFKAKEVDYRIEITGSGTKYRESGGSWEDYWKSEKNGLPPGVDVAVGETSGCRSYEISIQLSEIGNKAENFPENFKAWFMVVDGNPHGPVNYYPDALAGWWWAVESLRKPEPENGVKNTQGEEPPHFSAPEIPIGTIMVMIASFAALTLYALKRPTILK